MVAEEEQAFASLMEERWGFLAPWWEALKPHLRYTRPGFTEEIVWGPDDIVLEVTMPVRSGRDGEAKDEATFRKQFQKVREALALLVAVEHADYDAYAFIVTEHCGIRLGRHGEKLFEENIATKFWLRLDAGEQENTTDNGFIQYDLVRMCGTHQRENASEEYLVALSKIAALDGNLNSETSGVGIKSPLKLEFIAVSHTTQAAGSGESVKTLASIADAEKQIQKQWEAFAGDSEDKSVERGALQCTFVLEPMFADLSAITLTQDVAETLQSLVDDGVQLSLLDMVVSAHRADGGQELGARKALGQALRSLLGNTHRKHSDAHIDYHLDPTATKPSKGCHQLEAINLICEAAMPSGDFEAMCSALVHTQATKTLSLEMEDVLDPFHNINHQQRWKWLAYALFSPRARARSSIDTLVFPMLYRLNEIDARAFASVVASEHPEEELFGTPRGVLEERDAALTSGASIRWEFDNEGQPVLDSQLLTLDTDTPLVRTFSDDGESEWVNVMIPGFGRCQVQRRHLDFQCPIIPNSAPGGITSLTFTFDSDISAGLSIFIEAIGARLTSLTLKGPWRADVDENAIIRSCPNLQELTLARELFDVQLDFSDYRVTNTPVPELTFSWYDVARIAEHLSDAQNPLASCVRRLRVSLLRRWVLASDYHAGNLPSFDHYVNALLKMLQVNERLEYLEVQSAYFRYVNEFKKFHLLPIFRQRKPMPKKCRLAFLSVLASRAAPTKVPNEGEAAAAVQEIDRHVVANIFSFAAQPVIREVYFEAPERRAQAQQVQQDQQVQGQQQELQLQQEDRQEQEQDG